MTDAQVSVSIEGVWQLESYVRAGVSKSVTGVLFLTGGQWSTLYFVPQTTSGEYWGSGESGRYTLHGDRLTFHHRYTFQGGADKPVVTNLDSQVVEECRIEASVDQLTIYFPSGSIIRCRRHEK
jgi:hypothetical protein